MRVKAQGSEAHEIRQPAPGCHLGSGQNTSILKAPHVHPGPTSRIYNKSLIEVSDLSWRVPSKCGWEPKVTRWYWGRCGHLWPHPDASHKPNIALNSPVLDMPVLFFIQFIVLERMVLNGMEGLWLPKEIPAEDQMCIDSSLRPENKVPLATCWFYLTAFTIVHNNALFIR